MNDLAAREKIQAERLLAGDQVDQVDFEAAVLLDHDGRLLQVWPAKPQLIGRDMTADYAHLRAGLAGHTGVSQMVPSAARGVPIAAVAVPYESAAGRRVFSGAFSPSTTPLGSFLDSVIPIRGGSAFLVDQAGHVLAASAGQSGKGNEFVHLAVGVRQVDTNLGHMTVSVADVPDLAWRVVLIAPSGALYAPVAAGRWAAWALWFALAVSGCIAVGLFVRLGRARAAATAQTTASIGLAVLQQGDTALLLRETDMALYSAKAKGRNRVETCGPALNESLASPTA